MRVLCVDAYDSYTQNLVALFRDKFRERELHCKKRVDEIIVIRHDACEWKELSGYLQCFDAVVLSPGPGNPAIKKDVRLIADICTTRNIPLLGVCLGMQSLVVSHGGSITPMKQVKHGIVSRITHSSDDLFLGVPTVCYGTRYHSLHVNIANMPVQLRALAFAGTKADHDLCLMAFRHETLPHWGLQYHPDSVCSSHGLTIIKNFLDMAAKFNKVQRRLTNQLPGHFKELFGSSSEPIASPLKVKQDTMLKSAVVHADQPINIDTLYRTLCLQAQSDDFVLLDSAAAPGTWTYFSCVSSGMFRLNYLASDQIMKDTRKGEHTRASMDEAWTILKHHMEEHMLSMNSPRSVAPFCGGFVGWFSYEAGLQTMGLHDIQFDENVSDIALLFVERSIALDVVNNVMYVHSIAPNDEKWVRDIASKLESNLGESSSEIKSRSDQSLAPIVQQPSKRGYLEKIQMAKAEMRRGNSYEVCLTDQTLISMHERDPWKTYLSVRQKNPAPYAMFLRLGNETLIGSSPEMFLRCERGSCEMRPIKGTLKKTKGVDIEKAKEVLNNQKDKAENLMIVDLLRNDLYRVADIGSVQVSQLMAVEEYATVFQLVSSIIGKVTAPFTGLDVLACTLPPGSMTGAPKYKTCEILQKLEDRPRGVYSGVAGYWAVNDNHLWSVVIRSAYQRRDVTLAASQKRGPNHPPIWTVGAGGALLEMSRPEAEWEEMRTKANSVINGLLTTSVEFELLESILFDDSAADPCPLWSRHLKRLKRACDHFGFVAPREEEILKSIQEGKILRKRQKIRLTYQKSGQSKVECQLLASTTKLLDVKLDSVATAVQDFDFVRYKTTRRGHYDDARIRAGVTGLEEVLLFDNDGFLMEGSYSNIAVQKHSDVTKSSTWITPPSSVCLNGIMRDVLLNEGKIIEGKIHKDELKIGQQIMLFNAVRGLSWGILIP